MRMSACDWPDVLRNFWKVASLGKFCLRWESKDFLTSASVTLTPCFAASPWIHLYETSRLTTWSRSALYSLWHCFLSASSVVLGLPLAGAGVVLRLVAMHLVKFGASGTTAFAPPDFDATLSQWLNWSLSMVEPSTVATALPGTPPQPTANAAVRARAH